MTKRLELALKAKQQYQETGDTRLLIELMLHVIDEAEHELIVTKEVSKILGVSQQRVSQLSDPKRLEMGGHLTPAMKLPGITLYKRSEVLALADIRAQQAKSNHRIKVPA